MSDEKFWGWKGIGAHLGVSPNTAKKYAKKEGLPARKHGSGPKPRYFAFEHELRAWEEANSRLLGKDAGLPKAVEPTSHDEGGGSPVESPQAHAARAEKESPPAPRPQRSTGQIHAAVAGVVLALGAALAWWFLWDPSESDSPHPPGADIYYRPPVFAGKDCDVRFRYEQRGKRKVLGVYRDNERLWSDPLLSRNGTALAKWDEVGCSVVALPHDYPDFRLESTRVLHVFDASSGDLHETVELSVDNNFEHYSKTYSGRVHLTDVDGNGVHEVLATFFHRPHFPAFSTLYDPSSQLTGVVYVSAGHQAFLAQQDLDGQGPDELLFLQISNRFSWLGALAAVRVPDLQGRAIPARGPGVLSRPLDGKSMLWLALTPPGLCESADCLEIDPKEQTLKLHLAETTELGFDGLPLAVESSERDTSSELNERGLELLRDAANGHHRADRSKLAIIEPALDDLRTQAKDLGLEMLSVALGVQRLLALHSLGRSSEAEQLEMTLRRQRPGEAGELAYTVGRHLYLAEDFAQAATRLEEALRLDTRNSAGGRTLHEALKLLVFTRLGQQRCQDALGELGRIRGSSETDGSWLEFFVRWRCGRDPEPPQLSVPMNQPDIERYWSLESRSLKEEPLLLLEEVRYELDHQASETKPLLRGLMAQLFLQADLHEKARREIERALDDTALAEKHRFVQVMAHWPLLEERRDRIVLETRRFVQD